MQTAPHRPLIHMAFADLAEAEKSRESHEEPRNVQCSPFQLDKERIIRSRAFRRLKHKTQLFVTPRNDLFRTRMTHTLEAAQVARRIAEALGLNADLAEAIVLAHDLGHPPFGHAGERALNEAVMDAAARFRSEGRPLEFRPRFDHNEQSLKILTELEKCSPKFQGLNLTSVVLKGVAHRDAEDPEATAEAAVADFADDLTYINHDFQDLAESGILGTPPKELVRAMNALGASYEDCIDVLVNDIVVASADALRVAMSPEKRGAVREVKGYFKSEVIRTSIFRYKDEEAVHILRRLFEVYTEGDWEIIKRYVPAQTIRKWEFQGRYETAINHIACMTDPYALDQYEKILSPRITEY